MGLDRCVGALGILGMGLGLSLATPLKSLASCEGLEQNDGSGHRHNPLLAGSLLPFEAIRFDLIQPSDFRGAFEVALIHSRARLEAIRTNPDAPTFKNTILALDRFDLPLDLPSLVLENLKHSNASPAMESVAREWEPRLAAFKLEAPLDAAVFARVEAVYADRDTLGLSEAERRLIESTYRAFVRSGATLSPTAKAHVKQINERLATLSDEFQNRVRKATQAHQKHVTDPALLAGVPQRVLDRLATQAQARGKQGWLLDLEVTYPDVMQTAQNRELRQALWEAASRLGLGGEFDTRPLLLEIVQLRHELAKTYGYASFAEYTLADRMVATPARLRAFLDRLGRTYLPAATRELEDLRQLSGLEKLEPWDIRFYARAEKERRHGLDPEVLRPYFPYPQVLEGAFFAAGKNYGVSFTERKDLPVWHPTVQVFEVRDRDGGFLALFYIDPYQRESKNPGAWMNELRPAWASDGSERRPHVVNVMNFAAPIGSEPSLLSYREVTTLFHELGHGLHGMLTRVPFRDLSGTRVSRDFVELPSQFNERFVTHPEVLAIMARHYRTGEPIPQDLLQRFRAANRFMMGVQTLQKLRPAALDLAWHSVDPSNLRVEDLEGFEKSAISQYDLTPRPGSCISAGFTHIFSGGYEAGYYGYLWADVMAADAYSRLAPGPGFDVAGATRFRSTVLELGASVEPTELYRRFAGRDPEVGALLREQGLPE